MKRYLIIILVLVLHSIFVSLQAEDLLPSEVYYNENIAVNLIDAAAPKLATGGDGGIIPGGGEAGGGGYVDSPVGDALIPIVAATLAYGIFVFYRKRRKA